MAKKWPKKWPEKWPEQWPDSIELPPPRANLGCGAVDGGREVVAAGGWTDGWESSETATDIVEIYNVETDTWRAGMICKG